MKYLIFNLKANLNYEDIAKYSNSLDPYKKQIMLAPGYLYLDYFSHKGYKICSQDLSSMPSGNYTGEVSAEQLNKLGCTYSLIGHYERNKYFKENYDNIIKKINQASINNIKVILCLSEGKKNYNLGEITNQIQAIFSQLDTNYLKNIIIAYEPAFLIGQHKEIDINKTKIIITGIKDFIKQNFNFSPQVIYGGGITLDNISKLKKLHVDGLLIGTLATSLDNILTLLQILQQ